MKKYLSYEFASKSRKNMFIAIIAGLVEAVLFALLIILIAVAANYLSSLLAVRHYLYDVTP